MRQISIILLALPVILYSQTADPGSDSRMMVIEMKPGDTHLDRKPGTGAGRLGCWTRLDAASVSTRYRHVENFLGITTASNQQYQLAIRGSVCLDPHERITVHAGLFTGNNFTGGWNNAGPGTAVAQSNLYLKQLFLEVKPTDGIEVQYGGIEFARGESSEITSYDYDGYLVGGRILIRRPKATFFDDVAVTYGNIGDLGRPNVFRRLKRLGRSNYHQFLAAKRVGPRLRLSADYTSDSGADTLRQAITIRIPEIRVADSLHVEQYERPGRQAGYGFSVYGERKLARRFSLGGGYAQLDRLGLYSDRFNVGRRLFWNSHIALGPEWSVMALATYAIAGSPGTAPRTRFDLIVGYNLLHRLRSAGLF